MNPWRHRLRHARFMLGALIAAMLIAAAVAMGLAQLLLPLAAHYPGKLAGFLSQRMHRTVHFDSVSSQWQPSGPLLIVRGLTLGPEYSKGESLSLPRAEIKLDFSAWLKPAHRWVTLRLTGLELRVRHDASGWRVLGLGNPDQDQRAPLQSLPVDLDLRNVRVSIEDAELQRSYVLSSPRLRVVNIGDTLRFSGEISRKGSPQQVTVIGRFNPVRQDADLYIAGRTLDLARLTREVNLEGIDLRSGRGDVELWGSWRGNRLRSAAARLDLHALVVTAPGGRHAEAPMLSGVATIKRLQDGWELRYRDAGGFGDDMDQAGGVLIQLHGSGKTLKITSAARDLELAPLLPFIPLLPQAPASIGDWIAAAHPHGQIVAAALRWNANGRYAVVARLHALGAAAEGKLPGVDSLDGVLRGDSEALSFEVPEQSLTLAYPAQFRQPFALKAFSGTVVAWREDSLWHFGADALDFDSDRFGGSARLEVVMQEEGKKPFVDAYATVTHAEVTATKLFLPTSMPASTIAWLDRGLIAGNVDAGRVAIRGSLDDWPFADHQGHFEAVAQVRDAVLNYGDEWPRADHIDATAEFLDNQMVIDATHIETLGNTVTHAVATIPDLGNGELNLVATAHGTGESLLGYVKNSPVAGNAASTLANLSLSGDGKLGFSLSLPFDEPQNFSVDGNLQLSGGALVAKQWNLTLKDLGGVLHFDQKGFRADKLAARWHNVPASLFVALGDGASDPGHQFEASLTGEFSPAMLLQDYPDLASLAKVAHGVAHFRIGFAMASGSGPDAAGKTLSVQSDLRGVSLAMPAPLDKEASSQLPMTLQLGIPFQGAQLDLSLGSLLRAHGRLPDSTVRKPAALGIAFGTTQPAVPAAGMVVSGHAPTLDLGGWAQLAAGGVGSVDLQASTAAAVVGGLPTLTEAQLTTDQASAFGTKLGELSLHYATGPDAHTISFEGAALAGTLTLPSHGLAQRGISANMQRLYWPESETDNEAAPVASTTAGVAPSVADTAAAATTEGSSAASSVAAAEPPPATGTSDTKSDTLHGVAPSSLPPLHITVADLRLGETRLGETHFEATPVADGMRIVRMDTQSKNVQIRAHGDWLGTAQSSRSQMAIDLRSGNLGHMLEAFGFGGLIAGGEDTHVTIAGSWPGAPTAFALANLDGTLKFSIGEGRILEVKPGMGRLFGLFSIADLPRRLTLDFGDVYKSGFGFNSVKGNFTLKDGNAYTDDVEIKGSAAELHVRGRTGLRAHDYDQIVDATPHTGGTLAVVGAMVGGPIGAAAGLALSKGLNVAAHARYHITGSWAHPVITTISKVLPKPMQPATGASQALPLPASSTPVPAAAASSADHPAHASSSRQLPPPAASSGSATLPPNG